MIKYLNLDLQKIFDQYLRTTQIPVLEYQLKKGKLKYRWTNCVNGFNMPVEVIINSTAIMLTPTTSFKDMSIKATKLEVNNNYFIKTARIK